MKGSAKQFLRKNYLTKEGKHPVYLRVIINRNQKIYSTGIELYSEDLIKSDRFQVKASTNNPNSINIKLSDFHNRAIAILDDFARHQTPPTFNELYKFFKNSLTQQNFNQYINNNSKFSDETRWTNFDQLTKLSHFIAESKQAFQEIN